MDKIYFVVTVGRQVNGDTQLVRFEKAFRKASKADEYVKKLNFAWQETVQMETGPTPFACQRGVQECDFDDTE